MVRFVATICKSKGAHMACSIDDDAMIDDDDDVEDDINASVSLESE